MYEQKLNHILTNCTKSLVNGSPTSNKYYMNEDFNFLYMPILSFPLSHFRIVYVDKEHSVTCTISHDMVQISITDLSTKGQLKKYLEQKKKEIQKVSSVSVNRKTGQFTYSSFNKKLQDTAKKHLTTIVLLLEMGAIKEE